MHGIEGTPLFSGLENLRGRKDAEAIKLAAKELESLFAYELIKAMRQASEESSKGMGSDVYTSLFDMELARLMAERGLGLREMLLKGINRERYGAVRDSIRGVEGSERDNAVDRASPSPSPPNAQTYLSEQQGEAKVERFPVNGVVSSGYGMRRHPLYGDMRFHHGIDIAAPEGTDIYPIRAGKVIFSGEQGGYGKVVLIDHGDGYITRYAHNKLNLVRTGDYVDTDTAIAKVGNTGLSTGPHLHFEVRYNGEPIDPITLVAMRD
ncbi:MAG: peptidoglycan DD-metalloendopeptidase family protein [Thermodesulfovibrionales bacterium]